MNHEWLDGRLGPLDDAAVLRPAGAERSLVLTMDVLTPIVDDLRAFGGIAAVNSLSDVYAMGGRPEVALSFIGLPTGELPPNALTEVMAGLREACERAGCAIVGGHTIQDTEPKCGLAVVGSATPDRVWSQENAKPRDALVLSKPLGTGLVGHTIRAGTADSQLVTAATAQMLQLNEAACRVGQQFDVTAATDVTGFGLLGHLRNLVEAANVGAVLRASQVPLLAGVLDIAAAGCVPGGTKRNLKYAEHCTRFDDQVSQDVRLALADAQTSGGLLLCVPGDEAEHAADELRAAGCPRAAVIGELTEAVRPYIEVRK